MAGLVAGRGHPDLPFLCSPAAGWVVETASGLGGGPGAALASRRGTSEPVSPVQSGRRDGWEGRAAPNGGRARGPLLPRLCSRGAEPAPSAFWLPALGTAVAGGRWREIKQGRELLRVGKRGRHKGDATHVGKRGPSLLRLIDVHAHDCRPWTMSTRRRGQWPWRWPSLPASTALGAFDAIS